MITPYEKAMGHLYEIKKFCHDFIVIGRLKEAYVEEESGFCLVFGGEDALIDAMKKTAEEIDIFDDILRKGLQMEIVDAELCGAK